ncbi:MAG: CPBP family glutamic-type intramembrane protease [Bacillota bacterium]
MNIEKLYQKMVQLMLGMSLLGIILIWLILKEAPDQLISWSAFPGQVGIGLVGMLGLIIPALIMAGYKPEMIETGLEEILPICRLALYKLGIISLMAGVSEEILFRAFLQELTGIWPAALLFMLVHAGFWYKQENNIDRIIFGLFYLLAGVWLGSVYNYAGLIAAAVTHAGYDFILFWYFKKYLLESQEL